MSNKLTVQIYGNKYPITFQEDPSYVQQLAAEIDKTVTDLMRNSGRMSINDALVLTALNYLDACRKAEDGADNLRKQITAYVEDAAKARMELSEARKEIARMEKGMAAHA
ncbi:MAG: cell division protein ZapA [Oscillospiraceae bacterium]|jgi:cell division protein ZapA|nr:cell division protein ZapA [Oscillospiraceae bacterium]